MMVVIVKYLLFIVCILMSVAFFTLFERKILSYIQIRKGPNKVGYKGVLQPFSDAVKLFFKEMVFLSAGNFIVHFFMPVFMLSISLIIWLVTPSVLGSFELSLSLVFFMCCLSVSVYPILGAGWASNSKYSMLGSLRSVAQSISYEVSMALILMSFILFVSSYKLDQFNMFKEWFLFVAYPLSMIWFISSLAETSRTPFDFTEGESELVSGFNTEFSSGGFILFFLGEYSSVLFMSALFVYIFMGGAGYTFIVKFLVMIFLFVWVRGTLPRLRYDKLMDLMWKGFLPVSLGYLFFFLGAKMVFINLMSTL